MSYAATGTPPQVVHTIHHGGSAAAFLVPLVRALADAAIPAALWVEPSALAHPALAGTSVALAGAPCDLAHPWRPLALARLVSRLRGVRLIQAHQTRAALLPLLAAWMARVPVRIYHNHGLAYRTRHGLVGLALRVLERLNGRLATQVLFVSPSTRDAAVADGLVAPARAAVLGEGSICGIDTDRFHPPSPTQRQQARARWGIAGEGLVVGWVGRPVAHKGYGRLCAAWCETGLAAAGGTLLLAGPPARARDHQGIHCLGYLTDMPAFYHACDIVALPSDHEGLPYALLEGAACGCALLATDIPGNVDVVLPERTGLRCATTVASVATALVRLAGDAPLRARLGAGARAHVLAHFNRPAVLACLVAWTRQQLDAGHG